NGEIRMRYNDTACALIAEFLGAFVLVFTYLQVHEKRGGEVSGYAGLAIGFVFFAGMSLFGPLSGGFFNPAVVLGACVAGLTAWGDILMYLAGSLLGGAAAVSVFRIVNGEAA
ncbi:MAG: aquaporin, partial [Thermoanaerobaculia bacterium]|nr:aquaporin [Thermoanaerobaculia bacterium]